MNKSVAVALALWVGAGPAWAADKTVTVEGELRVGRFDVAIVGADGNGVAIATGSPVADQVLAVCQKGAVCKVTGVVDDADSGRLLKSVAKVEPVKK